MSIRPNTQTPKSLSSSGSLHNMSQSTADPTFQRRSEHRPVCGMWRVLLLALCLSQPLAVAAHEDPNARIPSLTYDIALNPNDARLFLKRGKLHRMSGHYEEALRDFEWAARRDPTLIEVDFQRALTLLEFGLPAQGKPYLDRYLGLKPDAGQALAARARTSIALGDNLGASAHSEAKRPLIPIQNGH